MCVTAVHGTTVCVHVISLWDSSVCSSSALDRRACGSSVCDRSACDITSGITVSSADSAAVWQDTEYDRTAVLY